MRRVPRQPISERSEKPAERSDSVSKDIASIRSLVPIAVGMLAVIAIAAFLVKLVP